MTIALDILLALVLLGFAFRGYRSGFAQSLGAIAGLVAGGAAGAFLAPLAGGLAPAGTARTVVTIAVVVLLLLVGYGIGHRVGAGIGRGIRRTPLSPVDRALGAVTQLAVSALAVSVLASLAISLGTPELRQPIAGSVVIGAIRTATPAPVEQALAQVQATALDAEPAASLG